MIFAMIGVVAVILSWMAGSYFRQSALDAQMHSLSRVIEVAAQEMLREVQKHTFDLGMKLGNGSELVRAMDDTGLAGREDRIIDLLDDPFINGFAGFADINLEKIRVYDLELNLVAQSSRGLQGLESRLAAHIAGILRGRSGVDRLKTVRALWISSRGPLHSTLVPIGGLRILGYLEVIINPAYNLPDIGNITRTPISIFSMQGEPVIDDGDKPRQGHLPIEYIVPTSDGQPAFRVVGYENVALLNEEMKKTQWVTISGFLLLSTGTLLLALWLFNRFLFLPFRRMVADMKRMADGEMSVEVDKHGLRDFNILASTFDAMARQVRLRTGDLEHLLDVDDSAILYFGDNKELVYANLGSARLFGYARDEIIGLDPGELFSEDIATLMDEAEPTEGARMQKRHVRLHGIGKDGAVVPVSAILSSLAVQGGHGYAIVMNPVSSVSQAGSSDDSLPSDVQRRRIETVEQSLNSLLEMARTRPGLMSGSIPLEQLSAGMAAQDKGKAACCGQVVGVMHAALACWEHDLGRSKLQLAEESRIWPVYIDKSTPTTRTLDKYLNIETCPRNPRTQRVLDTAEFVLRRTRGKETSARKRLQQAVADLRLTLSGMQPH